MPLVEQESKIEAIKSPHQTSHSETHHTAKNRSKPKPSARERVFKVTFSHLTLFSSFFPISQPSAIFMQ